MAKGYKQLAGYALAPAADSIQKSATYVVINNTGSYGFSYADQTNGQTTSSFISASVIRQGSGAGSPNLKLDINPVKWNRLDGTAGVVGDVTFVYRRIG